MPRIAKTVEQNAEKPLGVTVPSEAPVPTLVGRTVSLNFRNCDWLLSPSGAIMLTHETPTYAVPSDIRPEDLSCLEIKLKMNHLVLGDKPAPRHEKIPGRLAQVLRALEDHRIDRVKEDIAKIVAGPNVDGGFTKLELLEELYAAEERNPLTQKGGRNREEVLKYLKKAISFVTQNFGGVSKVYKEASPARPTPTSSGRPMGEGGNVDAKKFWTEE